jgi:hypothetical protein
MNMKNFLVAATSFLEPQRAEESMPDVALAKTGRCSVASRMDERSAARAQLHRRSFALRDFGKLGVATKVRPLSAQIVRLLVVALVTTALSLSANDAQKDKKLGMHSGGKKGWGGRALGLDLKLV